MYNKTMNTNSCNYDFRKDLPIAQATEAEVARLLNKVYNLSLVKTRNDNKYDLRMVNHKGEFTFEVKEDFTHARTGNIGLEYECRGKPSGINVSQADYYIYKIHNSDNTVEFYMFRTSVLKELIADKKYFRIVNGGDIGSNSLNYLFKDYILCSYGKKIG